MDDAIDPHFRIGFQPVPESIFVKVIPKFSANQIFPLQWSIDIINNQDVILTYLVEFYQHIGTDELGITG